MRRDPPHRALPHLRPARVDRLRRTDGGDAVTKPTADLELADAMEPKLCTARKPHRCGYPGCERRIEPGERYLRHSAPPYSEWHAGPGWWHSVECSTCARSYGRPIDGMTAPDAWCCWHGYASPDWCCLCVGDPCHDSVETRNLVAHDEQIARQTMTQPGETP